MDYEDVVAEVAEKLHVPNGTAEAMIAEYGQPVETYEDIAQMVRWAKRQQRRARKRRC